MRDRVEATAIAIYDFDDAGFPPRTRVPWDLAYHHVQQTYRGRARAAIHAYLGAETEKDPPDPEGPSGKSREETLTTRG